MNPGTVMKAAQRPSVTGPAFTPRAVTRGESTPVVQVGQVTKIDWLNATFVAPDRYTQAMFLSLLSRMFGRPLTGTEGRGMFGFDSGIKLIGHVGSRSFPIGFLAWGGEHQRGRWMLQFTGAGCGLVRSWSRMRKLLEALDARLTRVDLAVDFLHGEYTVDDAVAMQAAGEFTGRGRPPSSSVAGDWLELKKGRTLYIGQASNGKLLRVYEKGMQMGDLGSPWTRFEVQLGNRDRVIPLNVLTDRDTSMAGCYPALEKMLAVAGTPIATTQTAGEVTCSHLMFHMKRSYGKLFDVVAGMEGFDVAECIQEIRVVGVPRRVAPSQLLAQMTFSKLLKRIRTGGDKDL